MSIDKLTALITPPEAACENQIIDGFAQFKTDSGFSLPKDYCDFITCYGSGLFADFYFVYNALSSNKDLALRPNVEAISKIEREMKEQFGSEYAPYELYPNSPGLLPWGGDENGNVYFWLTAGEPDEWPVVQNEVRGSGYRLHEKCGLTEFFARVLSGDIPALAGGYPSAENLRFIQWSENDT